MYCILSDSTNPYFNLAAEEYFLRNFSEDFFILYQDEPSVIVGKHQNAISQINLNYLLDNNIKVARRLSGGGTVYHDMGNLNFCFISTSPDNNMVNFRKYTRPVMEVLWDMGLNVSSGGRNDILARGCKISGNAEHVFKNRVLHHGTLLFDSDLKTLSAALKVNLSRFNDNSVKSVRSRVINISGILENKISFDEFKMLIFKKISEKENSTYYSLSNNDLTEINKLVENKFSTWDWNFGYSPRYEYSFSKVYSEINLELKLMVEKGIIASCLISTDNGSNSFDDLNNRIKGLRHFPTDLDWLNDIDTIGKIKGSEIFSLFF